MLIFHRYLIVLGIILTSLSLFGLVALVIGYQELGKILIIGAPIGMLMMFTGITVLTLSTPPSVAAEENHKRLPD